MHLVAQLIKKTVEEKRTNQRYILLEGLCNSGKLNEENDKLELRYMDELFCIEKDIGEIQAVIGLQFTEEETQFIEDKWEEFPEPEVPEEKPKVEGDEDEEEEEEPAQEEDEEENKKPAFKIEEHKWTITNGRPKNLPQLFQNYKGINCHPELKQAASISSDNNEAITKAIDDFCGRLQEEGSRHIYLYQQVIFNE